MQTYWRVICGENMQTLTCVRRFHPFLCLAMKCVWCQSPPMVEKCISCMRCVSICPKHARGCDAQLMELLAEKMAPVLSGHKRNHLFL